MSEQDLLWAARMLAALTATARNIAGVRRKTR